MTQENIEVDQDLINEMSQKSISEIKYNTQLLENNIKITERTISSLNYRVKDIEQQTNANKEIIIKCKKTPYLISHVVETLKLVEEDADETYQDSGEELSAVIKTSRRETVFLPISGLLKASELEPSELVAVSRDAYTIYEKLPPHYDQRVKAMEVDTRPTETYEMCGGLEKQIQEMKEAIVLPLTQPERLQKIGIQAPKGVLLYGPPGTGKTMLARACAANTKSTFLRLAAPQLVQKYVGEGAKIVREAFELARSKAPTIIFIDEIDAVGGKRNDADGVTGEREVSRTMLELLNQLDGFTALEGVKVICATNRPDVLDPALLRSGRLDRKIELPLPNEEARVQILQIHSKNMKVSDDVNYREIARMTEDFNGAMLKAVCVEAGMVALRQNSDFISHEDFVEGVSQVQSKKKAFLDYFT